MTGYMKNICVYIVLLNKYNTNPKSDLLIFKLWVCFCKHCNNLSNQVIGPLLSKHVLVFDDYPAITIYSGG